MSALDQIRARYDAIEHSVDTLCRKISVKRLRPAEQMRLSELANPQDENLRPSLMLAASVRAIDDVVITFPRTRAELDSTLNALDREGIEAAAEAFMKLTPDQPTGEATGTADAAKN